MNRRIIAMALTAAVVATAGVAAAASGSGSGAASDFNPVVSYRLVNRVTLAANTPLAIQVVGVDGVPAGATAVTVGLTVAGPTSGGYLVAWPGQQSMPSPASDLNFSAGSGVSVTNLATVPIGTDGKIQVENRSGGPTALVVDLKGYYTPSAPAYVAPSTVSQTLAGVASVNTGGSFNSRATEVGTVSLPAGSYLVTLSAKATPIVQANPAVQVFPSVHLYNQPKNPAFTGDVLDAGGTALESGAITNADLYSSNSGVVTLTQATTLYVYATGYDSDSGEGTYQLDGVTVTATPVSLAAN